MSQPTIKASAGPIVGSIVGSSAGDGLRVGRSLRLVDGAVAEGPAFDSDALATASSLGEYVAMLTSRPIDRLISRDECLDALTQLERIAAHIEALKVTYRSQLDDAQPVRLHISTSAELGLATNLSAGQAGYLLYEAAMLVGPLSAVREAMARGHFGLAHSRIIVGVLSPLLASPEVTPQGKSAEEVAAHLAARAATYAASHTPAQTKRMLQLWMRTTDPRSAEDRHREAVHMRGVSHTVLDDGLGLLSITGAVDLTLRAYQALDRTARADSAAAPVGDERLIGHFRSDLVLNLILEAATPAGELPPELGTSLLMGPEIEPFDPSLSRREARIRYGGTQGEYCGPGPSIEDSKRWREPTGFRCVRDDLGPVYEPDVPEEPEPDGSFDASSLRRRRRGRPVLGKFCRTGTAAYQVMITVDVQTLLGIADNPMLLDGTIPITAWHGRRLFSQADFTRLLLESDTGVLIDASPWTYRPNRATARRVALRDMVCTVPGCLVPSSRCEVDHVIAFNHSDPASGGPTTVAGLGELCKADHQRKTLMSFWIDTDATGRKQWVTPLGRRYPMEPFDHRPTRGVV